MLRSKPPPMDWQNAWPTNMVFHTVVLLTKELTSHPEKYNSEPMIMESTSLTIVPTILKPLGWQKDGMAFWKQIQHLGGSSLKSWGWFSLRQYMFWISIQYMVQFLLLPVFTGPGLKWWKRKWFHSLLPPAIHQEHFSTCSYNLKFYWPGNFGLRWRSTLARRHNRHRTGLESDFHLATMDFWYP